MWTKRQEIIQKDRRVKCPKIQFGQAELILHVKTIKKVASQIVSTGSYN